MDSLLLAAGNNNVNMLQEKPVSPIRAASPPSAASSPSHEFSFTISLHHHSSDSTSLVPDHNSNKTNINNKAKTTPSSLAIDLSPADDIFFHGHLLPLQFLSHLPVSPRSSTNSLDSFTLPIRGLLDDHRQEPIFNKESNNLCTSIATNNNNIINKKKSNSSSNIQDSKSNNNETNGRTKSKSFSIFGLPKRRKECEDQKEEGMKQQKRKMKFDVSNILKRYVRMIGPLLFSRGRKDNNNVHFSRQPYSFSGNLSPKNRHHHHFRGIRGELSAPTSMRTSPTNSGILLATSGASTPPTNSTNDSTMEELNAAIQAAIAHCKNSISTEEKTKCLD